MVFSLNGRYYSGHSEDKGDEVQAIYVISTTPRAGKTGTCAAIILRARERGLAAGYMKPIGTLPIRVGDVVVDEDCHRMQSLLGVEGEPRHVSPLMLTPQFVHAHLARPRTNCPEVVAGAFEACSEGRDLVVVEGLSYLHQGRWLGLSAARVAKLIDARVLLIAEFDGESALDDILAARDGLRDRLVGVILNRVDASRLPLVNDSVITFLADGGVRVLGAVPEDEGLRGVTVEEVATRLQGRVVSGGDELAATIGSFMVGAMGQRKALSFFKAKGDKAVITGGDREDIQLAALDTETVALLLTGNQKPTKRVIAKATKKKVPIVTVDMDTMSTVERVEALVTRARIHDERRVNRMRRLLSDSVDLDALLDGLER